MVDALYHLIMRWCLDKRNMNRSRENRIPFPVCENKILEDFILGSKKLQTKAKFLDTNQDPIPCPLQAKSIFREEVL